MAMAGAAVLLLGGGGAYFFLAPSGKAAGKHVAAVLPQAAPAPIFVPLAPLNVPLWQGDRVMGFYLVALQLEVPSDAARRTVETRLPLLLDAFVCGITGRELRPTDPDMLDFTALKGHLQFLADKVLGKGIVDKVLIVHAMRNMG